MRIDRNLELHYGRGGKVSTYLRLIITCDMLGAIAAFDVFSGGSGMIGIRLGGAVLIAALLAGAAQAHSPYLMPNAFDATGRDHVTVEASFTEHVFIPDVVM